MAMEVGVLVCEYRRVDGTPATGKIIVQPVNNYDDGSIVVVPSAVSYDIEPDGSFAASVYVDNVDITPDLYLKITEKIDGVLNPKPYIIKPEGQETNLATAVRYTLGPLLPSGDGTQGPPGEAATITVGSTTTGAAGTNASVVNAGTTSQAVLNFTIPRGAQGVQGVQGNPGVDGEDGADGQDTNYLWVNVVTGNEARPAVDNVLWIGGSTEPINIAIGDVWLKEAAP